MMRIHRYWLLAIAVALCAVIGPPATAQPPAEASLGFTDEIPPIVGMTGEAFVIRILARDTFDFHGLRFFEIETSPGGRITVMADGDLAIAKALLRFADRKVRLTLEPIDLQRLERR